MDRICKHCGLPEESHHDFELRMPNGCQCDPFEWGGNIPIPCDAYQGDGAQHCVRCEHDRACHKPSKKRQQAASQ
jgi:hypothetical protein